MANHLLQVEELTVSYADHNSPVIDRVTFKLEEGESCGLIGDSGCGKTTLAYTLVRLLPSTARILGGQILFKGRNLFALSEREMGRVRGRMIAMLPQDPEQALNPVLKVGTQIEEVISGSKSLGRQERQNRACQLLEQVGLWNPGIYSAYPHQLSGGQRQRIVLAQALAGEPALLIADEPTSALDGATAARMLALLTELKLQRKLTMLLISHDTFLLSRASQRVLKLAGGSISECELVPFSK